MLNGRHCKNDLAKGIGLGRGKEIWPFLQSIYANKEKHTLVLLRGRKWGTQFHQQPPQRESSPLGRSWAVSSTYIKHTSTLRPSNSIARYFCKRNKHICPPEEWEMPTAALLMAGKNWKRNQQCPSTNEWINKVLYMRTMNYDPGVI